MPCQALHALPKGSRWNSTTTCPQIPARLGGASDLVGEPLSAEEMSSATSIQKSCYGTLTSGCKWGGESSEVYNHYNLGCDWEFVEMKLQRRAWDFPIAMLIDYSHLLPKTQYVDNGTKRQQVSRRVHQKKRIEWSKTHCKLKLNESLLHVF